MQMNEQVLTALEVLRNFAENDFERHRIDVLEKDLISPPKVEQIDDNHQKFNGLTFSTDNKGHYRLNVNLHRLLWLYYFGKIPDNFDVHHKNENKSDNAISNLELLPHDEHTRLHLKKRGVIAFKKKPITCICQFCGKTFNATNIGHNKFCSVSCRNKNDRQRLKEKRNCVICGNSFEVYKYDKTKTCSAHCSKILMHLNLKNAPPKKKTCKYCGKEFETRSNRAQFCSEKCRNNFHKL